GRGCWVAGGVRVVFVFLSRPARPAGGGGAAAFAPAARAPALLQPAPPPPQWTVELGAEVRSLPHWQGSDDYGFYPYPLFDVRTAGTPPRFHGPRDGFGYALYDTDAVKAGPVVQVELGRHVKHNPDLAGLGDVGLAAEIGGVRGLF